MGEITVHTTFIKMNKQVRKSHKDYSKIPYEAFLPLSKHDRFVNALNLIENFLMEYDSPYKFKLANKTTNNFEDFKKEVSKNQYMLVSNEGNEKTIYSKPYYNTIARVWHDTLHLKYDLDFSYEDEKIVCYLQIMDLDTYGTKRGACLSTIEDAKELIYHDIIGQANYYKLKKQFVDNQKKFVYGRFLNKGNYEGIKNEVK